MYKRQLPDSGKQLIVDGGNGYDGAYGCPGYGLPDKLGLAHVAGREPFRKLGVFFLGHACLDYPAAVRRVVSFSYDKNLLSTAAWLRRDKRRKPHKQGLGKALPNKIPAGAK